ncbi:AbiJ-related protein [Rhodococcus qingshengii]
MTRIDLTVLRGELAQPISGLTSCTHEELDAEFSKLGLIEPPGEGRTKAERVAAVLTAIPDDDLERVAAELINRNMTDAAERNNIQDALWAGNDVPQILKRTRREIAADLDLEDLVVEPSRFTHMLDQLWVLGGENPFFSIFGAVPAFGSRPSLRERIERHVYQNPGDWPAEKLFEELGAFEASDRRFALFLERLVSHEVVPSEAIQRKILEVINPHLRKNRLELRESGTDGGYPVFRLVSAGLGPVRRPKNLIFASSTKPDLRLSDVLDNDIEILSSESDVLVFDEPIGNDGMRWRDLQSWWSRTHPDQTDFEAKNALYKRLYSSLPESSPPQQLLFTLYHHIFRDSIPELPALLPEVWLHWDPQTVKQRGADAMLKFRMDFLLLLPDHRIVLEVDGKQHYTNSRGYSDPATYAENVRSDREMKLCGYEVFRFGASELQTEEQARPMLTDFFRTMFDRYKVATP